MCDDKKNLIVDLTFEFSLKIIEYTELLESKRKFNMANQLFRAGTAIGANVNEAQNAESKKDFVHKMKIAAKECDESSYWLKLCKAAPSYPDPDGLMEDVIVLNKILSKIISSSKE
ncbi:MAG: four helix bundle protein [Bacteroidetes bacterium]|nr:four helix bundle protein [Bacteroidota bacterium]